MDDQLVLPDWMKSIGIFAAKAAIVGVVFAVSVNAVFENALERAPVIVARGLQGNWAQIVSALASIDTLPPEQQKKAVAEAQKIVAKWRPVFEDIIQK